MSKSDVGKFNEFEWDERKNDLNFERHTIDFEDAIAIFSEPVLNKRSDRNNEIRYLAIGLLEDIEIAVVYTMRGDVCRIISARQARTNEREEYHQAISKRS